MGNEQELITAQELAGVLKLSVETIWRYTREKRIPYIEMGKRKYRYNKDAVLAALRGTEFGGRVEEGTVQDYGKKLTYADYAKLPDEPGFQYEVIDGLLIREPSPSVHHQRISRRLQRILEDYFHEVDPDGELFGAPLDVSLEKYTVVQPDLLYFPGNRPVERTPINTFPELIVEILSPTTRRKDRVTKLKIYQQWGVPHYWLVDPEDNLIEAYELRDGHYASIVRICDGLFRHPSFPGLSFELEALFAKPGFHS